MFKQVGILIIMAGVLAGCASNGNQSTRVVKKMPGLEGKTQKQVRRSLGKPVVVREEAPNKLWAYHDKGCSTLVYFDGEGVCQHAEMRGECGLI